MLIFSSFQYGVPYIYQITGTYPVIHARPNFVDGRVGAFDRKRRGWENTCTC
jgi:hypothetical protein